MSYMAYAMTNDDHSAYAAVFMTTDGLNPNYKLLEDAVSCACDAYSRIVEGGIGINVYVRVPEPVFHHIMSEYPICNTMVFTADRVMFGLDVKEPA